MFVKSHTHVYWSHCHMILFLWYTLFVSISGSIWLSSVCWVIMSWLLVAIVHCHHECCFCLEDTVCSVLVWSYHNHLDLSHRHFFWINVVFTATIQLSIGCWNLSLRMWPRISFIAMLISYSYLSALSFLIQHLTLNCV